MDFTGLDHLRVKEKVVVIRAADTNKTNLHLVDRLTFSFDLYIWSQKDGMHHCTFFLKYIIQQSVFI